MPEGKSHELLFPMGVPFYEFQTCPPRSLINSDRRHFFGFTLERLASSGERLIPSDIEMSALETVDFFYRHRGLSSNLPIVAQGVFRLTSLIFSPAPE